MPGPPLGAHRPGRSARPSIRLVGPQGSILATCLSDYCMSPCPHYRVRTNTTRGGRRALYGTGIRSPINRFCDCVAPDFHTQSDRYGFIALLRGGARRAMIWGTKARLNLESNAKMGHMSHEHLLPCYRLNFNSPPVLSSSSWDLASASQLRHRCWREGSAARAGAIQSRHLCKSEPAPVSSMGD